MVGVKQLEDGAEKAAFSKIQTYLSGWRTNKKSKDKTDLIPLKLSSREYDTGLKYIYAQAPNPSGNSYGSFMIKYPNEELRATGIEALVVLQDNLMWLNDEEVEEGQAYEALFKNITDYLLYTKITRNEKQYEAIVLQLQPIVTKLLLKTTDLRMKAESQKERQENIDLYTKHNPFPLSPNLSSKEMTYIYYENMRIRDLEEKPKNNEKVSAEPQNDPILQKELTKTPMVEIEIAQRNLLKDLDEYIGTKSKREGEESKEKSSLTNGEEQKKPTLKERKVAIAREMRGILENKDETKLIGNKVLALKFCLKLENGAVLSRHRNRFKQKTENFLENMGKLLDGLAQNFFGNKDATVCAKQEKEKNVYCRARFFVPQSGKLLVAMEKELALLHRYFHEPCTKEEFPSLQRHSYKPL